MNEQAIDKVVESMATFRPDLSVETIRSWIEDYLKTGIEPKAESQ